MLVLSRRPPRPHSMTATSTPSSANQLKAIEVVTSKKDRGSSLALSPQRSAQACTASSGMSLRPDASRMRALSLRSSMCGEV